MNQNNQGGFVLPEHIRASLSKYSEHEQLTCLECGYSGLMGVSKKIDRVSKAKSWTIIGSVVAILALVGLYRTTKGYELFPWWVNFGIGVVAASFTLGSIKTYECPNCNKELNRK